MILECPECKRTNNIYIMPNPNGNIFDLNYLWCRTCGHKWENKG